MYECTCGFAASSATTFHKHLMATADDPATDHHLRANGRGTGAAPAEPRRAQSPGTRGNGRAKANRPLPAAASAPSADPQQAQQRQGQWQVPAAAPSAASADWDGLDGLGGLDSWVQEYVLGAAPPGRSTSASGAVAGTPSPPAWLAAAPLPSAASAPALGHPTQSAPQPASRPAPPASDLSRSSSFGGSFLSAFSGYSWLSDTVGHAASAAVAAAVAAAASAVLANPDPSPPSSSGDLRSAGANAQPQKQEQQRRQQEERRRQQEERRRQQEERRRQQEEEKRRRELEVPAARRASFAAGGRAGASGGGGDARLNEGPGADGEVVRSLLLWRDPGASARALGAGLYLIMLAGCIPRGLEYLQVTTLLPGAALLLLAYNVAKRPAVSGYCKVTGGDPSAVQLSLATAEERAASGAARWLAAGARAAGGAASGALALCGRALRGESPTGTAWTAAFLWVLLVVSELRVLPQTLLAMVAYSGLFFVPWLYAQFRETMDAALYEALHFAALLFAGCERASLALAAGFGLAAWHLAEAVGASLVVRATGGAAAAFAALVWRTAAA